VALFVPLGFDRIAMLGTTVVRTAKPNWPITKLAKLALRDHLYSVIHQLRLAADKWEDDIEHVHQLRVATRRASAALRVFQEYLPRGQFRRVCKELQKIRRNAGLARDLDVLVHRVQSTPRDDTRPTDGEDASGLSLHLRRLRRRVQKPLAKQNRKLKAKRFKARVRRLIDRVRWRGTGSEETVAVAAKRALRPLLTEFFHISQEDLSDTQALHQLRIRGKRVRYACELFAGAFDREVGDEVYALFVTLQEKLGRINDHATAKALYERCRHDASSAAEQQQFTELAKAEGRQIRDTTREFHDWWNEERTAELARLCHDLVEFDPDAD
jgi:CHAD domain-containing protein